MNRRANATHKPRRPLLLTYPDWRRALRFRDLDGTLVLTDRRRRSLLWQVPAILWLATLPALGIATVFNSPDPVFSLLVGCIALGLPSVALFLAVCLYTRTHRSFTVRADVFERRCICHCRLWGWKTRRIETSLSDTRWELETTFYREPDVKEQQPHAAWLHIILLFVGPLGWIALLLPSSTRKNRGNTHRVAPAHEAVRLSLRTPEGIQAVIITGDEANTTAFLTAWDSFRKR